jgi:hypothetical protein
MSRRIEIAYKAQSPGKSAQHDQAPGSGDRVNAAVAWRQFTFLSGEICPTCGCLTSREHLPVNRPVGQPVTKSRRHPERVPPEAETRNKEKPNRKVERWIQAAAPLGATRGVNGQKSAEAIVAKSPA